MLHRSTIDKKYSTFFHRVYYFTYLCTRIKNINYECKRIIRQSGRTPRGENGSRKGNAILKSRLDKVNKIIYANNLVLGSPDYFEVRELCTKHLK